MSFLQEVNDCFLELFQSYLYFQSMGSNRLTYQVGHQPDTLGKALGSWAVWPNWGHWARWDVTREGALLLGLPQFHLGPWPCLWVEIKDPTEVG